MGIVYKQEFSYSSSSVEKLLNGSLNVKYARIDIILKLNNFFYL